VARRKKDPERRLFDLQFRRKVLGENGLVDRFQAAEMMHVTERTLLRRHREEKGPPRIYAGRSVCYRIADIDAWLRESGQKSAGDPDPLVNVHPATEAA
jgi:hypothetical protein